MVLKVRKETVAPPKTEAKGKALKGKKVGWKASTQQQNPHRSPTSQQVRQRGSQGSPNLKDTTTRRKMLSSHYSIIKHRRPWGQA